MKKLDFYIIKKFIGTYVGSLSLFILIAIMCDVNENLDDFIKYNVPLKAVVMEHYLMFIPWFVALFSPLFVFISVIFFTSKLADNSEIISIFAGGISFKRLMYPYLFSAFLISSLNYYLNGFLIPRANEVRQNFKEVYMNKRKAVSVTNMQIKISPDVVAYIERYNEKRQIGFHFSLEKFNDKHLVSRLSAESITYDSLNHWTLNNYKIRDLSGNVENIVTGRKLDTTLLLNPEDLLATYQAWERMTTPELYSYINRQKQRGVGGVEPFVIEFEQRHALVMTAFVLTIIGASLSSKKVRGGMGVNIGLGLGLAAFYLLFVQISSMFAIGGAMPPRIAAWIPNIIFMFVAFALYKKACK